MENFSRVIILLTSETQLSRRTKIGMPPFFFRCPITGSEVQGFVVDETPGKDTDSYELVTCFACGQKHLVNFKTGKTVGAQRNDK
jgi:hypothetical protein